MCFLLFEFQNKYFLLPGKFTNQLRKLLINNILSMIKNVFLIYTNVSNNYKNKCYTKNTEYLINNSNFKINKIKNTSLISKIYFDSNKNQL